MYGKHWLEGILESHWLGSTQAVPVRNLLWCQTSTIPPISVALGPTSFFWKVFCQQRCILRDCHWPQDGNIISQLIHGCTSTHAANFDVLFSILFGWKLAAYWSITFDMTVNQPPAGPRTLIRDAKEYYNIFAPQQLTNMLALMCCCQTGSTSHWYMDVGTENSSDDDCTRFRLHPLQRAWRLLVQTSSIGSWHQWLPMCWLFTSWKATRSSWIIISSFASSLRMAPPTTHQTRSAGKCAGISDFCPGGIDGWSLCGEAVLHGTFRFRLRISVANASFYLADAARTGR